MPPRAVGRELCGRFRFGVGPSGIAIVQGSRSRAQLEFGVGVVCELLAAVITAGEFRPSPWASAVVPRLEEGDAAWSVDLFSNG
jgi:hypothetical protein